VSLPDDRLATFERLAGQALRAYREALPGTEWQARVMDATRQLTPPRREVEAKGILLPVVTASLLVCAVSLLSLSGSIERLADAVSYNDWTAWLGTGRGYPF